MIEPGALAPLSGNCWELRLETEMTGGDILLNKKQEITWPDRARPLPLLLSLTQLGLGANKRGASTKD